MTTGLGFDALGESPAGLGTPTQNSALAVLGYQRSTTGAVSSVQVTGRERDYAYDDNGNEVGMGDTAQRVFLCIKTTAGSRIEYPESGLSIPETINGNMGPIMTERVRRAMAPVLDDGSVSLDNVDVTADGTMLVCVVTWTDLRTLKQRQERLPLRA